MITGCRSSESEEEAKDTQRGIYRYGDAESQS